jgi:hypothetical protein
MPYSHNWLLTGVLPTCTFVPLKNRNSKIVKMETEMDKRKTENNIGQRQMKRIQSITKRCKRVICGCHGDTLSHKIGTPLSHKIGKQRVFTTCTFVP